MSIKKLTPYLTLNGTAEKAIKLYESALGARVEAIQRFGEVAEMKTAPEHKDRVMHAMLRIDEGTLMLSDTMPNTPPPAGGNVHVVLELDDVADMTRKFDALAVGGKVTFPLHDTFWGAKFGMLIDAFGVPWMFNCTKPTA